MAFIYVYNDEGISKQAYKALFHTLSKHFEGSQFTVESISSTELKEGDWQDRTHLLAIGGGYDTGFVHALGDTGASHIRNFVNDGGRYLGICAGAYFASDEIEFDKGGPLEILAKRSLRFFPGRCIGPVFPGFKYGTEKGAFGVPLLWHAAKQRFFSYFNGGGHFIANPKESSTRPYEIIASYEEDNLTSVVKCQVGKGIAILSGAHFEYDASDVCKSSKDGEKISQRIDATELTRKEFVESVMNQFENQNHKL